MANQLDGGGAMKILSIATAVAAICVCSTAGAQVTIRGAQLQFHDACLNDAIRNGNVGDDGNHITFACFNAVARGWFYHLGDANEESVRQKSGLWVRRTFNGGYCAQLIPDGSSAGGYDCVIATPQ
jgi:hypothetical protein